MTSVDETASAFQSLEVSAKKSDKSHSKKTDVADSWEDEVDASSDTETEILRSGRPASSDHPGAPPPTPVSPPSSAGKASSGPQDEELNYGGSFGPSGRPDFVTASKGPDKRPEKSTAVASRLIAAGLGLKPPRRTQEQRDYDRAIRLQEKKKRDEAREAEEKKKRDKEQAQKDIWGD